MELTRPVSCWFFYGINYSDEEFLHLKKLLLAASQEITIHGFSGGVSEEELEVGLNDIIDSVNRSWAEQGDPVSLYHEQPERDFGCLSIRETFHSSPRTRRGAEGVSFNLESLDLRAWDLSLKSKCERFKLPWTQPAFQLIATAYENETYDIVRVGYCFYGLFLGRVKKMKIGKNWKKIDADWKQKDDPVTLLKVEDSSGIPEDNWLYLGIRASFIKAETSEEGREIEGKRQGGIAELSLLVQKPSVWNEQLKSKCEKYGIGWKEPKFYLFVL